MKAGYGYGARFYDPAMGRFTGVDPLADEGASWTPYRYAFNNPLIYIDPDGLFETKKEAKQYAKDNKIKIRPKSFIGKLFTSGSRSNIVENSDGTFSIDNGAENTSISDLGTDDDGNELGVMTSALISPNDIMSMETEGNLLTGTTITATTRSGDEVDMTPITGTAPVPGPGKLIKGYKYVRTIGKKYDVYQKVVKSKKLGGQARAVYTKIKNKAGKTVRFFKDSFKRDGRHYERANKHPKKSRSRKLD